MLTKISTRQAWLVLAVGATPLLSGCGERVLEAENAAIKNGKIYRSGADEPFSGKLTNARDGVLLQGQPTAPIIQTLMAVVPKDTTLDKVVFTGSLCDVTVKKGVLQGDAVCKFPNTEAKRWEIVFRDGQIDGDLAFNGPPPENYRLVNATFDNGVLDGPLEVFSPSTGKRVLKNTVKAGVADGEETAWDAMTGNVIGKAAYAAGKLHGNVVRYAPDGQTVIYRSTLAAGLHNGTEEEFSSSTGKPKKRVEWINGKKNGKLQVWDDQGALVMDLVYRDDVLVTKSESPEPSAGRADTCVDAWGAAHRKEYGQDAVSTIDQIKEWEKWCDQGKKPA